METAVFPLQQIPIADYRSSSCRQGLCATEAVRRKEQEKRGPRAQTQDGRSRQSLRARQERRSTPGPFSCVWQGGIGASRRQARFVEQTVQDFSARIVRARRPRRDSTQGGDELQRDTPDDFVQSV